MKITKFGHACLLVEEGSAKLLIDPGTFSEGFEGLTDVSAVLYTHKHPDHFYADALAKLLETNPDMRVLADEGTAAEIGTSDKVEVVHDGDELDIAGVSVKGIGSDHAVMHPDQPVDTNVGYLIAGRLFHAGDNYVVPGEPVEILAFASVAPWAKVSETVDYVRAVAPRIALPIHDAITTAPDMYAQMIDGMTAADIKLQTIKDGVSVEF